MEGIEGRKKLKELKAGKNFTEGRKKWQERMEGRKATLVLCFTNGITRDESGILVKGRGHAGGQSIFQVALVFLSQ